MTRKERIQEIKRRLGPMTRSSPDPLGLNAAEVTIRLQEMCDILLELEAEIEKGKREKRETIV